MGKIGVHIELYTFHSVFCENTFNCIKIKIKPQLCCYSLIVLNCRGGWNKQGGWYSQEKIHKKGGSLLSEFWVIFLKKPLVK